MQIGIEGARVIVLREEHDFGYAVGVEIGGYRNARRLPRWVNDLANMVFGCG